MFARALLAFIACPGIVALAVPLTWLLVSGQAAIVNAWGLLPLALGLAALLWCVYAFYATGKGTLAPWAPPQHLVVTGLYRHSRNPMYVAVLLILLGWAVTSHVRGLYFYAAGIAVVFHLRVVFGEEPWLARRHGEAWREYAARVPRWLF
jgi:protein-S-isoprenylcysteine O-methyltransferase Ste14